MTTDLQDHELDTLLDDTRAVPVAGAQTLAAGRVALATALDTARIEVATRRRRLRRSAALAVAAVAAAAAVVVGPIVSVPGHRPTAPAAAAVLNAAADSAGRQAGGWPRAAYWHATSTYVRDGRTFHREIWIAHHGTTRLVDPGVDPGVISYTSRAPFGAGLDWEQLYALPTEPTALAATLRRYDVGKGRNPDQQLFSTAAELLGESPASPSLRRALYLVAAAVPGVRADGAVTDRSGRRGQGVSRDGEQVVVDTATGQLLEARQTGDHGTWVATYESQGPAATAPESRP